MLYQEAENYIKEVFWRDTHDKRSKIDVPKIVADKLRADLENEESYFKHREGVVHVSDLSKCLRGVVHQMLQADKDAELEDRILGVFKAGHLFEDFVVDALGDRVVERQREYLYQYKNLTLVGRSDFRIDDDGVMRIGENKSVHSQAFWHRQKEGTLIAYHNQIQLQTYLWLERQLFQHEWDGLFTYVSKDDVTIEAAPVKYNQDIIDKIVIPALDIISEAYEKKDPNIAPCPEPIVFHSARNQWQKNWLASYCEYHSQCAGANWILEADAEIKKRNLEIKAAKKAK